MNPYYDEGGITIYHGDCREVLPGLSAHLLVTSPPYFNARPYSFWPTIEDYVREMTEAIGQCVAAVGEGRMICFNVSSVIEPRQSRAGRSVRHNLPAIFAQMLSDADLWFQEDIVWEKPEGAAINRSQRFYVDRHPLQWRANPTTERILVYQRPTSELNDTIIKSYGVPGDVPLFDRGEVWRINPSSPNGHPAPFPKAIPERLIQCYSWPGDVVLDPFMGSGTALSVAKRLGRRAIGIEIEERYCEIAVQRLAQGVLDFSASRSTPNG